MCKWSLTEFKYKYSNKKKSFIEMKDVTQRVRLCDADIMPGWGPGHAYSCARSRDPY